jgi:hypothetical protein
MPILGMLDHLPLLPGPAKNQISIPITGNSNTHIIYRIFSVPEALLWIIFKIAKISIANTSNTLREYICYLPNVITGYFFKC